MNQSFINTAVLLTAYDPPGPLNCVFFMLTFFLYVFTILANLILILVIYMDSSLHKPMYIFLLNLAVNGLIGCSAVCPNVMDNLLRDAQSISYGGCLLQVLFINVYALNAYAILAVMAYDRYVSICKPLQYHTIVTPSKVKLLLTVVYFIPVTLLSFQVYLTSQLPLCRFVINKLFCDNLSVVKLSCVKSALGNIYGLFITASLVVLPFFLVLLSYMKILHVSLRASKESQKKALSTCAPHLIVFINFSVSILFSVVYNRHSTVSKYVNHLISAQFIFFPPLLHPLVYGIRTEEIRRSITKVIQRGILAGPL
ncbi:olfactory receptor 52D1-like [Centroberyx gerrardi]|uniref:olfactory receptor 52D1-like n=1 Tax=Centroberyx gerrardi TaxID=166262 RepID=UPI003AAB9E96